MINNHIHISSSSKAPFERALHCQPNPAHQTHTSSSSSSLPSLGYPCNGLVSFYPPPSLIPFSTTTAATMKDDSGGARNPLPGHPLVGYSGHSHPPVRIGGGGKVFQYSPLHCRQRSVRCSYYNPARQTPPRNFVDGDCDASEPSSPEVTCMGRIKIKQKGDGEGEGGVGVAQQWHVSLPINKNKTKKKKKKNNNKKEMNNNNNNNNNKIEEEEKHEKGVHRIIVTSLAKEVKEGGEEEKCLSPLCLPVGAGKAIMWIKALRKPPTQTVLASDDNGEIFEIDLGRFRSADIYDHGVFSTKSDPQSLTLNTTTTYRHKTRRRPKRGVVEEDQDTGINDRSGDVVVVPPSNALLLMRRHMNDEATATITTTVMACHHSDDGLGVAKERRVTKQPAEEEWSPAESPEPEPTSIFNILKIPQGAGFKIDPCIDNVSEETTIIRQCSLPKPPIETTLWKRRAFAQLSTLIIERPSKLEVKKPTTR